MEVIAMGTLLRVARRRLGITLIEVGVVLTIFLILSGILLSVYTGAVRWSKRQIGHATSTRDSRLIGEMSHVDD